MSSAWLGDELSYKIKEDENYHEHSPQVAEDVINGKVDITILVERLSGVLTDMNVEYRVRGMAFFSKVLSYFPNDFLTEKQLQFICTFYIDRLKDNHRVIPSVVSGLLATIKMKNLPKDVSCKILQGINQNVPCQQQVRTDRTVIYQIFMFLTQNYKDEIITMGPDLVYTVISAMDGERDPRNLMLLFSFLPEFLSHIPLAHLTEEMFEVIACYYPIDFNPPQDDPNAITRDNLAEKLCICLCATPEFAEFCLPLLLEKLESDLKIAKLDSLKLLTQSCTKFNAESYEPHIQTLWTHLQRTLTNKSDAEVSQVAHESLAALVNKLCCHTEPAMGEAFLNQVINSMKILLADAKTKPLLLQPLQILLTCANASEKSCIFITEAVIPLLVLHHHLNLDKHLQISSLQWFSSMFTVCKTWNVLSQVQQLFVEFPKICFVGLNNDNDELKVACFETLAVFSEMIEPNDIPTLCQLMDSYLSKNQTKLVENASKQCLLTLSSRQPDAFKDFILSKIEFDTLPRESEFVKKHLDILCSLISVDSYTQIIMTKLLQVLNSSDTEITNLLISSFSNNLNNKNLFKDDLIRCIQKEYEIIKHILCCVEKNIESFAKSENFCKSIIIIVRALDSEAQSELLSNYIPQYLDKLQSNELFTIILEALLNSTKQDVNIHNTDKLVSSVMNLAINGQNPLVVQKSCLIIANLLNKYIDNEQITGQYERIKTELNNRLDVNKMELINKNVITLCSWICKSLFLNGHADAKYWLNNLIQLLYIDTWSSETAKAFKLITSDIPDALNSSCYCKVNFFYHQKLFHTFSQITTELLATLPVDYNKESYLLAYAHIIQIVPKIVILMEAPKICSVLIESLSFSDPDLIKSNLSTLCHLIEAKNITVAGSLQSLVPRVIKLASFKSSMDVRIASLQCLYHIANCYPTVATLIYKDDVVYQLAPVLDDHKRLVRNAAVKARTRWFLVGAPGEDKLKS